MKSFALALFLATFSLTAQSTVVFVDTGTPVDLGAPGLVLAGDNDFSNFEYQHLAGQFELGHTSSLDTIEHFVRDTTGGPLEVVIRSDASNTPGVRLFSALFDVPSNPGSDWYAFEDLSWALDAGVYWVAFEPTILGTYWSVATKSVPIPLDRYAFDHALTDGYQNILLQSGFGVRISGSVVPVPGAVWLFGSALGLLGWARRKKA